MGNYWSIHLSDLLADNGTVVAAREYGAKVEGSSAALNASVLAELAALIASGDLDILIAATFPLDQVRAAFSLLGQGHIRGKIVLLP